MFKNAIITKPESVRTWLRVETAKALPSLQADVMLRDMIRELISIPGEDDISIENKLEDIRGHISKVITDYLHRARIRALKIDAHVSLEGKKVHTILTLSAWGRRANKYLEFTA